jgi:hypothetical protein
MAPLEASERLIVYTKSKFDALPNAFLKALREELEGWTKN